MISKTILKQKLKKRYKVHCIKKEQRVYDEMLRGVEQRGTDILFNPRTIAWLIVVVTGFLQLISLSTTFEGSKVYFGGIALPLGLSAPLLFALSVQLIVFCMGHTIRKYFKPWLVLILCMATLCSTYFSYVGIYNHIYSPVDYLEERYKQIYGKMTDEYELTIDESNNQMKAYTFELISTLGNAYTSLVKTAEEHVLLEEKINNIKVDTGRINAQTSSLRKPNMNNYGEDLDRYYADMAKYNAAVGNMITDTTKQDADLKNQLYDNEVKSILGGKTKEAFIEESVKVETQKEQLEKVVTSMYQLVGGKDEKLGIQDKLLEIQSYIIDYILLSQGDSQIISTLLTQMHTQAVDLGETKGFETFKKELNQFILMSQKNTVLMKSSDELNEEVKKSLGIQFITEKDAMLLYTTMQSEIKNAAFLLNQIKGDTDLIDLNSEAYSMHNLYVLPIKKLTTIGEGMAMAWFALAFAILIDGLTLLFALMEGKEKSALLANRNRDIIGGSKEAMDEVLLSNLVAMGKTVAKRDTITEANRNLKGFLDQFTIISEAMESGYSMWAPLEKLTENHVFIAVLCQFNLASILTGKEVEIVEKEQLKEDAKYVFLKTKFIIWANKKMVSLTQKEEYMERLQEVELQEVEGEMI